MTPNEYQQAAMSTLVTDNSRDTLSMCGLGIAGEAGEIADMLKKYLFHKNGKALDISKVQAEIGDCLWYLSVLASDCGLSLENIMQANIDKLARRHKRNGEPTGFQSFYESDSGDSLNR